MDSLEHNRRYSAVHIRMPAEMPMVTIWDAVIWRADKDFVDIAQYGQTCSSILFETERVVSCSHTDNNCLIIYVK